MIGLIAYKGSAAQCIGQEGQKYAIRTTGGKSLNVRAKDFYFVHPEFAQPRPTVEPELTNLTAFSEEILSLEEVCELLFEAYTPHTAWRTYELIQDSVYGYFVKGGICIRPSEHVEKIVTKRAQEAAELATLTGFVRHFEQGEYSSLDEEILVRMAGVAYGKLKTHKIFKLLDLGSTPEQAHQFLVQVGYWHKYHNPYPKRLGIMDTAECHWQADTSECDVREYVDMTHIPAYAIDNAGANDADDAISIVDGYIWVHIADVASLMTPQLMEYALERASNVYLPDSVYRMLPPEITPKRALAGTTSALSIGCQFTGTELIDIRIQYSMIHITALTYVEAEELLETQLSAYWHIAKEHHAYRTSHGAFTVDIPKIDVYVDNHESIPPKDWALRLRSGERTNARMMVAEWMIIAGRAAAQYAHEHQIAMPYVTQAPVVLETSPQEMTIAEKFTLIKTLPRSKITTTMRSHNAMGLKGYIRVTSPLRRILDLVAHIQLDRHLGGQEILTDAQIQEYIEQTERVLGSIHKCQRTSEQWYKLLHISEQAKDTKYQGIVITTLSKKSLVFLYAYSLIVEVPQALQRGCECTLAFIEIDTYQCTSSWRVVSA